MHKDQVVHHPKEVVLAQIVEKNNLRFKEAALHVQVLYAQAVHLPVAVHLLYVRAILPVVALP